MTLRRSAMLVAVVALAAGPAYARFGKSGSSGSSSSSSSHGSSSSGSRSSGGSSSSSSHGAAPVGSVPSSGSSSSSGYTSYEPSASFFGRQSYYRYGYYSGAFVPMYGYGYAYYPQGAYTTYGYGLQPGVRTEEAAIRVSAGLEAMPMIVTQSGVAVGLSALFEGERWGFSAFAQDLALRADDGSGTFDHIPQVNLHATFAFLTGRYGRLRAELGLDTVFAPSAVFLGPTAGLSGTLWIGGPVALEGLATVTPYPFWQLDYRAGLVVGLGPVGLRVGWRTQVLDDRGKVDGVIHRDVYMGPYGGISLAL